MRFTPLCAVLIGLLCLASCAPAPVTSSRPTLVVTYAVLGDVVTELVGDQFRVVVSMPNGLDPHEWEPSARDMEALNKANMIIRNGLGLEGGMEKALAAAAGRGVPLFTASDHIVIRHVRSGEGLPTGDADQAEGAEDPHLWLDPRQMKSVVLALAEDLNQRFGSDLQQRARALAAKLDALDTLLRTQADSVPAAKRVLVTGHESLGYFAEAYGFQLVGAIIPSLSTRAEVSAADLAHLRQTLVAHPVPVLFTEFGTPAKVAQVLASELHLNTVEVVTHLLPEQGGYEALMKALMSTIVGALTKS